MTYRSHTSDTHESLPRGPRNHSGVCVLFCSLKKKKKTFFFSLTLTVYHYMVLRYLLKLLDVAYVVAIYPACSLSLLTLMSLNPFSQPSLSYNSIHTEHRRNAQLHYIIDSLLHNRLSLTPALNYSDSQLGGLELLNSFQSTCLQKAHLHLTEAFMLSGHKKNESVSQMVTHVFHLFIKCIILVVLRYKLVLSLLTL